MLYSIGLILLLGIVAKGLFERLKLPGLLGMLLLGVIIGPYALNILDANTLAISADLRKFALIVILLKAGLGINKDDLLKVGPAALKMAFIPCVIEGFFVALASTVFLGFTLLEGGMLGFIVAAVSPAVVVPLMLKLQERRLGTNKGVPTLILSGASVDDVVSITFLTVFIGLNLNQGGHMGVELLKIPITILGGIGMGALAGLGLLQVFRRISFKDLDRILILLATCILLTAIEAQLKPIVDISAYLAIMTLGFTINLKDPARSKRKSKAFNQIWGFAQILLFVLVGAQVDVTVAMKAGLAGIILVAIGLVGRSLGVWLSTAGSALNKKERLFAMMAYSPKATVQAAVASLPLAAGLPSGQVILAIGVLSIILTAPLGAILIKRYAPRLLVQEYEDMDRDVIQF